jgi:hypothetical protein
MQSEPAIYRTPYDKISIIREYSKMVRGQHHRLWETVISFAYVRFADLETDYNRKGQNYTLTTRDEWAQDVALKLYKALERDVKEKKKLRWKHGRSFYLYLQRTVTNHRNDILGAQRDEVGAINEDERSQAYETMIDPKADMRLRKKAADSIGARIPALGRDRDEDDRPGVADNTAGIRADDNEAVIDRMILKGWMKHPPIPYKEMGPRELMLISVLNRDVTERRLDGLDDTHETIVFGGVEYTDPDCSIAGMAKQLARLTGETWTKRRVTQALSALAKKGRERRDAAGKTAEQRWQQWHDRERRARMWRAHCRRPHNLSADAEPISLPSPSVLVHERAAA